VAVGDVWAFGSADRLAAYAGLVPAAHDSGKRVGNHRKGRGGNKVLKRVFYRASWCSGPTPIRSSSRNGGASEERLRSTRWT
jgi:transposase